MAAWRELYDDATERLGSTIDARRIVERAAGWEGSEFVPGLDQPVPARAIPFFEDMVARRSAGEPLQYVVGRWGFRHLDLVVDRRVLIPRPETEQVVEVALAEARHLGRPLVAVDLGTGSGAIGLSLALEIRGDPGLRVVATDVSPDALAVARANLTGLGTLAATRVRLLEGSWYAALPEDLRGRVGLIVSNPPYVAPGDDLPAEVADWEPSGALVPGPTGLEAVAEIVAGAPAWLRRPGALVVEIAPHQAGAVVELATAAGFDAGSIEVRPDLAGRDRCLVARLGLQPGPDMPILPAFGDPPPAAAIAAAAEALAAGLVVGLPTDTVYGLTADAFGAGGGAERLFAAKRRPRHVDLPVLVADVDQALGLTVDVPPVARRLMERFWPGGLTIVLRRHPDVVADLGSSVATIGVRCPAHPVPLALSRLAGPLATTSANRHGESTLPTAAAIASDFGALVAVVLDAGPCEGDPSTVVDCTGEEPSLLRQGVVAWPDIAGA